MFLSFCFGLELFRLLPLYFVPNRCDRIDLDVFDVDVEIRGLKTIVIV